jgi:hypothetical protein
MIAPIPTPWPNPLPIPQNSPVQDDVESAVAATPRPKSPTEAAARTVSVTGAATELVHSGCGRTSGWGPLVKMREHPGFATRASIANEIRNTEFTIPQGPLSPGPFDTPGETVSLHSFVGPHRGSDYAVRNIIRLYRIKNNPNDDAEFRFFRGIVPVASLFISP